ncbi:DNA-binding protein [Dolichospermum circinale]|uniref:DNA-binding protein n=1 Tax=Dolichospermum circinale TaxID=109265 RepID=UPI00232AB63B|nr:DNA-binding protein [Dolichospermum circinale]MDB9448570.1 DNA-binding protein [Dolichospermum circinale CS-547]
MTSTTFEPSLKDKVFEICENLHSKNQKINRDIVREQLGGGSFTDISPLVAEWRKLKKLESVQSDSLGGVVIENESTEISTKICTEPSTKSDGLDDATNLVLSQESEITDAAQELNATSLNPAFIPDSDINSMVRAGAEKAAGTLIAQEAIATHFYQNPDQLPSDLKAQLEGARGNFTQSRSNTNKAAYNPQNLINLAMQKIQETQREDGLELIG